MSSNKRFELPVDGMDDEYVYGSQDNEALFGPVARKTMVVIALIMLILIGVGFLLSNPLTIFPFLLVVFVIHYYRKMSKAHYRKKNRTHRKN